MGSDLTTLCSPGGCSGLKKPELGQGVFWGADEPPLLLCAKPLTFAYRPLN